MGIREDEQTWNISLKKATVLFLLKENEVLLALKKRGFGEGKWNGVGGKPNPNEDILDTAIRESQEEIGVTPLDPKKVAVFKYYFPTDNFGMQVWVFTANKWQGVPIETEEMKPEWFKFEDIPYNQMWSDDEIWLPQILENKLLTGSFVFDKEGKTIDYYLDESND